MGNNSIIMVYERYLGSITHRCWPCPSDNSWMNDVRASKVAEKDYHIWYNSRSILLKCQTPSLNDTKAQPNSSTQGPIKQTLPVVCQPNSEKVGATSPMRDLLAKEVLIFYLKSITWVNIVSMRPQKNYLTIYVQEC